MLWPHRDLRPLLGFPRAPCVVSGEMLNHGRFLPPWLQNEANLQPEVAAFPVVLIAAQGSCISCCRSHGTRSLHCGPPGYGKRNGKTCRENKPLSALIAKGQVWGTHCITRTGSSCSSVDPGSTHRAPWAAGAVGAQLPFTQGTAPVAHGGTS